MDNISYFNFNELPVELQESIYSYLDKKTASNLRATETLKRSNTKLQTIFDERMAQQIIQDISKAQPDYIRLKEACTAPNSKGIFNYTPLFKTIGNLLADEVAKEKPNYDLLKELCRVPSWKSVVSTMMLRNDKWGSAVVELFLHAVNADAHELIEKLIENPNIGSSLVVNKSVIPGIPDTTLSDQIISNLVWGNKINVFKAVFSHPKFQKKDYYDKAIKTAIALGIDKRADMLDFIYTLDPTNLSKCLEAKITAQYGNKERLQKLIQSSQANNAKVVEEVLKGTIIGGHANIAKEVLQDPKLEFASSASEALGMAIQYQLKEIFQILFKRADIDPSYNDNEAIIIACVLGDSESLALLLRDAKVNPAAQDNSPIIAASDGGHAKIVKILLRLPEVDPTADNNAAILAAEAEGHKEVVQLLLKDSRIQETLNDEDKIRLQIMVA
ncbi:MAG: hypothetical protein K0S74_1663 [Chlamydiales bacterium]|jgi:hypothetical protein|nr:hypothetical protein [Chlamydiales bacterium]